MTYDEKCDFWINRGHALLDKKYWNEWDTQARVYAADKLDGRLLGQCLTIIENLKAGKSFENVRNIAENIFSHNLAEGSIAFLPPSTYEESIMGMVEIFCDQGDSFAEYMINRNNK